MATIPVSKVIYNLHVFYVKSVLRATNRVYVSYDQLLYIDKPTPAAAILNITTASSNIANINRSEMTQISSGGINISYNLKVYRGIVLLF